MSEQLLFLSQGVQAIHPGPLHQRDDMYGRGLSKLLPLQLLRP